MGSTRIHLTRTLTTTLHHNNIAQAGPFVFLRLAHGSANAYCDALRTRAALMLVPSPCFEFGDKHVRKPATLRTQPATLSV